MRLLTSRADQCYYCRVFTKGQTGFDTAAVLLWGRAVFEEQTLNTLAKLTGNVNKTAYALAA